LKYRQCCQFLSEHTDYINECVDSLEVSKILKAAPIGIV
jgi:hypothetical protein